MAREQLARWATLTFERACGRIGRHLERGESPMSSQRRQRSQWKAVSVYSFHLWKPWITNHPYVPLSEKSGWHFEITYQSA